MKMRKYVFDKNVQVKFAHKIDNPNMEDYLKVGQTTDRSASSVVEYPSGLITDTYQTATQASLVTNWVLVKDADGQLWLAEPVEESD